MDFAICLGLVCNVFGCLNLFNLLKELFQLVRHITIKVAFSGRYLLKLCMSWQAIRNFVLNIFIHFSDHFIDVLVIRGLLLILILSSLGRDLEGEFSYWYLGLRDYFSPLV